MYCGGSSTGQTVALVKFAYENDRQIVYMTKASKQRILNVAKTLELEIKVVTMDELAELDNSSGNADIKK